MTRKEGKGYLGRDFGGHALADSTNSLELIGAAERAQRIAICDDAFCEGGAHAAKGFDFSSRSDIDIDDRGGRRSLDFSRRNEVNGSRFLAWSLSLLVGRLLANRINSLDLSIEGASRCCIYRGLTM